MAITRCSNGPCTSAPLPTVKSASVAVSEPFDQPVAVDGEVLGREERRNLVNRGGVGCEVDAEWTGDVLAVDDDLSEHGGIVLGGHDGAGHQTAESLRSLIRGV